MGLIRVGLKVIATRRRDAVGCALCLAEGGHDPATPREVYRGSTLALRGRSIGKAAKLTVADDRPRFVEAAGEPSRPFPPTHRGEGLVV